MGVIIDIAIEGTITGVKKFSGEIVAGILFTVLFFLFPSLRKFFSRKKYDTEEESQKNLEILRQDISQLKEILKRMEESKDKTAAISKQTHHEDEYRVKAELQRKQEELKQAEEAEHTKNIDEILLPFETIRQKQKQAEESKPTKNIDEILLPFETIRQPQKNQSQHQPESTTSQRKAPLRVQRRILPRPGITQRNSDRTRRDLYSEFQRLHQTKTRRKPHSFFKFFVLLVLVVSAFMLVKSFLF